MISFCFFKKYITRAVNDILTALTNLTIEKLVQKVLLETAYMISFLDTFNATYSLDMHSLVQFILKLMHSYPYVNTNKWNCDIWVNWLTTITLAPSL